MEAFCAEPISCSVAVPGQQLILQEQSCDRPVAWSKAPSNELVTFLVLCDHEALTSCYNSFHEVFFSSGEGRGITLVRLAMGKSIGRSASCFLYGTCSNLTCGSCSFSYNSPMCGAVAGPCQLCSGFRLNVVDFRKALVSGCQRTDCKWLQMSDSDIVEESKEQAATGAHCWKAIGPWHSHKCHKWIPFNAVNGEHTLNYSWAGSILLASETLL